MTNEPKKKKHLDDESAYQLAPLKYQIDVPVEVTP
jgi:hypothetical protein